MAYAKWWLETSALLAVARFMIRFLPFRYWRWTLGPIDHNIIPPLSNQSVADKKARTVGRWVRRTARTMPFEAVCLPQAMAGRWMLKRRGITGKVYLGAGYKSDSEGAAYHAWLMYGDICLTGQQEREHFQAFGKKTKN